MYNHVMIYQEKDKSFAIAMLEEIREIYPTTTKIMTHLKGTYGYISGHHEFETGGWVINSINDCFDIVRDKHKYGLLDNGNDINLAEWWAKAKKINQGELK